MSGGNHPNTVGNQHVNPYQPANGTFTTSAVDPGISLKNGSTAMPSNNNLQSSKMSISRSSMGSRTSLPTASEMTRVMTRGRISKSKLRLHSPRKASI
eukprot:1380926-Amorphochlora_amoeboformis.AAC.1